MTLITDSSFLVALYDIGEVHHLKAYDFAANRSETILVPDLVLPEAGFLLRRNLGYANSFNFFDFFDHSFVRLVPAIEGDLARVYQISRQYESARFDIVDCCIMAIAERLNITRIATFDRRDFSMFRPSHCEYLELLP
ncbi:MAG: PIN domain-containing protein [Chloroflexota bacterium]|nr:PIN domain-containing protein [Chloroflexota bacterium]MDE2950069.1 PIN domain-containing protein [Chloroflexota bacterium]